SAIAGAASRPRRAADERSCKTSKGVTAMSELSSLVTDEHFRYVAEHTVREDAFLADLKRAAKDEGIPSIWIAPEQASFMQILLELARAKEVVEVGTLAGYSAIAMARALPDGGRVGTIEIVP